MAGRKRFLVLGAGLMGAGWVRPPTLTAPVGNFAAVAAGPDATQPVRSGSPRPGRRRPA